MPILTILDPFTHAKVTRPLVIDAERAVRHVVVAPVTVSALAFPVTLGRVEILGTAEKRYVTHSASHFPSRIISRMKLRRQS
jgi:hypothetical protein